jgi:hypothetical protein
VLHTHSLSHSLPPYPAHHCHLQDKPYITMQKWRTVQQASAANHRVRPYPIPHHQGYHHPVAHERQYQHQHQHQQQDQQYTGARHSVERRPAVVVARQIGSMVPRSLIPGSYPSMAPSVTYVTLPENGSAFEASYVDPRRSILRLWLADVVMNNTARDILRETPTLADDAIHIKAGTHHYHFDGCAACRDQAYILVEHVKARSVPHKTVALELDGVWWLPSLQVNRLYIVNGAVDLHLTVPACVMVCILSTKRKLCNFCCDSATTPIPSSSTSTCSSSPSPTPSPLHACIASPPATQVQDDEDTLAMFTDETLDGLV